MRIASLLLTLVLGGASLAAGTTPARTSAGTAQPARPDQQQAHGALQLVARFAHQVTGVTVSERGRIRTAALRGPGLAGEDIGSQVQSYGRVGPTGGLWIGRGTEILFVTAIEDNAVKARNLAQGPDAALRTVWQDARLRWPDTFNQGPDGSLHVTTSRIQDAAFFHRDAPLALPTQLWRLQRPRH